MGCGESKIKEISLTPEIHMNGHPETKLNGLENKPGGLIIPASPNFDDSTFLPNRLLAAIPVSDLGDSLDSRHLSESLNLSHGFGHSFNKKDHSDKDGLNLSNSDDSGYDEYDEEYSHIITEYSAPELVEKVEREFKPVDLPELLVITGRACTRIMSGYQKNKADEAKILESLREEGLLAMPKGKTAGGLSFEVVDSALLDTKPVDDSEGGDVFVSSQFIPSKTLARLELRRETIKRPALQIDEKLEQAEVRRKAVEEEKVKSVLERSGIDKQSRGRSASAYQREKQFSATVAKRQQQLQEIRDRLKDKHKKNDMIKLKRQLMGGSSGTSSLDNSFRITGPGHINGTIGVGGPKDNFFDD